MVKKIRRGSRTLYVCEACGAVYLDKKLAEKCQQWCPQHQSCNLEIIQYAVPPDEPSKQ